MSIVPIGLTGSNNTDPKNELGSIESRIKDLEATLTDFILGQSDENIDVNKVRADLEKARAEDFVLRNQDGGHSSVKDDRTNEISSKIGAAEYRIRDLESLKQSILNGENDVNVSNVENSDLDEVCKQLEIAKQYKQELEVAKSFWDKAFKSNLETKIQNVKSVDKENFLNGGSGYFDDEIGLTGLNRLDDLEGLLSAFITGKPFGKNVSGVDSDIQTGDSNILRQEIFRVQNDLLSKLPKAKNEPWFKEVIDFASKKIDSLSKEKVNHEKRLKELEKQLANSNSADDMNEIRQEIYREKMFLGESDKYTDFLSKLTKAPDLKPLEKGDVNGDGKVDNADSKSLEDAINGKDLLLGENRKAADVNGDGKVDKKDLALLQTPSNIPAEDPPPTQKPPLSQKPPELHKPLVCFEPKRDIGSATPKKNIRNPYSDLLGMQKIDDIISMIEERTPKKKVK